MAQSGFTPISLYYSSTGAAVPSAGNLVAGELALNTNDGKLYYKNSSGVVTLLAGATSGPAGGSTTQVQYNNAGVLAGITGATTNGTALTLTAPVLGTPASGTVTNLTGTASININGTVGATTPAAGAFTTLSATGLITSTVSGRVLLNNTPTTGNNYIQLANTGNNLYLGKETSAGGSLFVGSSAYAAIFGNDGNFPVQIAANNTVVGSFSSTGLAVTGTLSLTDDITITKSGNTTIYMGASTRWLQWLDSSSIMRIGVASAQVAAFSSTGLEVTGTLSASGATTLATTLVVTAASNGLGVVINGRSSDNLGAMYFYANNGTTNYATITTSAAEFRHSAVPAASVQTFYTNASERMRIDANGNVGIGTTNPASVLDVVAQSDTAGGAGITLGNSAGNRKWLTRFGTNSDLGYYLDFYDGASWANRLALTYTGNVGIGALSVNGGVQYGGSVFAALSAGTICGQFANTANGQQTLSIWNKDTTGDNSFISFATETAIANRGSISYNRAGGLTVYNTTSDYRLKKHIVDLPNALETVSKLKPRQFDWKETGNTTTGFIAHELAEVCPHAVTGEKDAVEMQQYEISPAVAATQDEEGNELTAAVEAVMGEREVPKYQGIDTSFLVATLTAALQEAHGLIKDLTTRITALEAK